tara:strand:- start:340 stop:522 length:183 start_codon:yes stop_codon:yes gene_type:complete
MPDTEQSDSDGFNISNLMGATIIGLILILGFVIYQQGQQIDVAVKMIGELNEARVEAVKK